MASPVDLADGVEIAPGVHIPWIGLGTYEALGDSVYRAVRVALDEGYRHIDTAAFYENEAEIGRAVRDSGIPRDEIFVTTKLWNSDQPRARAAFERSQELLDLGVLDLYLLHWPVPRHRLDAWAELEKLQREGRCRAIGVSNFMPWHLEELLDACEIPPAVNQIEASPFLQQRETVACCRQHGIAVQAYSPLTKAQRLDDPRLAAVAARLGRTPAQVLVRWCLEHDLIVLPKSATPERIRENASVIDWELDPDARAELDALDEGFRTSWDPTRER